MYPQRASTGVAIAILLDTSFHRPTLESYLRPTGEEAGNSLGSIRTVVVDVLLRTIANLYGLGAKVRHLTHFFTSWELTWTPHIASYDLYLPQPLSSQWLITNQSQSEWRSQYVIPAMLVHSSQLMSYIFFS